MAKHNRIRVLEIIARLNIGGPAVYVVQLSRELAEVGLPSLLVCGRVDSNEGDMGYLAEEMGIQPVYVPELGRKISFFDDVKAFLMIRRVISQWRPRIVHTHTAKAGTLGRLAVLSINVFKRKRQRIRTVHTFHGHIFHSYFGPAKTLLFAKIEMALAKCTDRIIAISSLQKRDLCERFGIADEGKVVVIPLGFDLSRYRECDQYRVAAREKFLPTGMSARFVVGMIGRLTSIKNPYMLLEAISILKNQGRLHEFLFLVVGDGELRDEMISAAARLQISEAMVFTGWEKNMPPIYGALDALTLTSRNEGTPVTIIEAMAAGKPVVATSVGGVPDLLGDIEEENFKGFSLSQRGILVPSGDANALAEAILFLEKHRAAAARMVQKARHFALAKYSSVRMIMNIERLYESLERIGEMIDYEGRKKI